MKFVISCLPYNEDSGAARCEWFPTAALHVHISYSGSKLNKRDVELQYGHGVVSACMYNRADKSTMSQ